MARRARSARPATLPIRPDREATLVRHRRAVLIAIVIASALLRVAYATQIAGTPFAAYDRLDQTDMHYYDGWGRAIAGGDWQSATVGVPMHAWQHSVAGRYFEEHPAARATLASSPGPGGSSSDADARLWSRWMNGHEFYQDPLYPYLIGLTYAITGAHPPAVMAWQLLLGVGTNVLIWLLARRYFGDLTALVAAAMAVLSAPLLYYEFLLLRESTIVFAGLGCTWLLARALEGDRWPRYFVLGVAVGAALMLKSTFLLFVAAAILATLVRFRTDLRGQWRPVAALLAGIVVVLLPLIVRNISLGVPPVTLASSGPLTFAASNAAGVPPDGGFYIDAGQLAQILGEGDGRTWPVILATLRGHTISSFAWMVWQKFDLAWHWHDIPNNENIYHARLFIPVLGAMPFTAWVLAPLGVIGLLVPGRPRRTLWPLYLLVACALTPLLLFYVLGRFRILLLASVIPFAAAAVVNLITWLRQQQWTKVGATAAAAALMLVFWTGRALPAGQLLIRPTDWLLPYLAVYETEIRQAEDAGDLARIGTAYRAFFRYQPDDATLLRLGTPDVVRTFAEMHRRCALVFTDLGRADAARVEQAEADRLDRLQ